MDGAGEQFEIQPGENFACMVLFPGLSISCSGGKRHFLGSGCWASEDLPFKLGGLDGWFRRQLGEFVWDQVTNSNFVLTAKAQSAQLENLGTENETLLGRLQFLLWGIAITAGVPLIENGRFFSGSKTAEQVDLCNSASVESFYQTDGTPQPTATIEDLRKAARFAERLEKIHQVRKSDERLYYRLASGLGGFVVALKAHQAAAKHHQFVRAIESFLPPPVSGRKKFSQYAGDLLSADPQPVTVLQQMYDLRSAAEHHRPFDTRALSGVAAADAVAMQRTRQAEAFARELFRRFFAEDEDCLQHFKDDDALNLLWSDTSDTAELKRIWGSPFDLHAIA